MTSITFVRHGNTYWNNEKRAQGYSQNPLSEVGIKQAHAVAERLANEPWDLFICSDLKRAMQTADIISEAINMPIDFYDKRIREIGRGEITGTIESERVEKWGENWRDLDLGVESYEALRARGLDFVEDMVKRYPGKKLLVVTHGLLLGQILKGLLEDEETGNKLVNCSVTTLNKTEDGWIYDIYNCTKHFEGVNLDG